MKVAICYPPLQSSKGIPLLGQNRQFQWANNPWTAYPMVPAYAATLLKGSGYEVVWLDGVTEGQTYDEWEKELKEFGPDLIVIETKTPVVKKHWSIVDILKEKLPNSKIVLMGDHVTALPEESFEKCGVDYVITGGDYDFSLLNLANHLDRGEVLAPGVWFRDSQETPRSLGKFQLTHSLDELPFIDRDLTKWQLYAYKNTNYLRKPGTYTMVGRDCWWGKCSFCSWTTLFPGEKFRVRSAALALDEVGYLIENYGIREIMDDSGTFPVGDWMREFCEGMIERGYSRKIKIDCNMRFNANLSKQDYALMGKAGFRFLLYGFESANQKTLDRINKNSKLEYIEPVLRHAKVAGLYPHITVMVGYPWETKKDAQKTVDTAKDLFRRGLVDSLQATVVIPYPGTPLFKECDENGWLLTRDWDRYDMREPIMKTEMSSEELMSLTRGLYTAFLSPSFLFRKTKEALTDKDTFLYYSHLASKYFSKLLDFGRKQ